MFRLLLCLGLLISGACAVAADPVFRCVSKAGEIRYQAQDCGGGMTETKLELLDAPTPVPGERDRSIEFAESRTPSKTTQTRAPRRSGGASQAKQSAQSTDENRSMPRKAKRRRASVEPVLSVPGCPPTYEDPGTYVVSDRWVKTPSGERRKVFSGMREAWGDYKNLPTRTYLKNAGKWPDHCPQ